MPARGHLVKRTEGPARKPMRSRHRNTGPTPETVGIVAKRDQGSCAYCGGEILGERGWDWSVQHRLRRGNGGTDREFVNLAGNLVLLCGSGTTKCHGLVEGNPAWARQHGFRVDDGETLPADTPIEHAVHGRVLLDDEGGTWTEAP